MRSIPAIIGAIGLIGTSASAHDTYQPGYFGDDGYLDRPDRPGDWRRGGDDREIVVRGRRLPRHLEVSRRVRLDPWLADIWEGRKFVRDHYRVTRWNTIDEDDAENANVFFRRWADHDRDYRLTDTEIHTALNHIANSYGLPDTPGHAGPVRIRHDSHRPEHRSRPRHRHHDRRQHDAHQDQPKPPIIESYPYGERG